MWVPIPRRRREPAQEHELREVCRAARVKRAEKSPLLRVPRVQSVARAIAERAAQLAGAPIGAVDLIFADFRLTVAGYGTEEIKREIGYGRYVVDQQAAFQCDLYLGVPLRTTDGYVIGALRVSDDVPRPWGEKDVELLTGLAEDLMHAEAPRRPDRFPPGRRSRERAPRPGAAVGESARVSGAPRWTLPST